MTRLTETFTRLHRQNQRAFIPFLVIGDPTPDAFLEIVQTIEPHADVIELGIPFSDPIADGPVIQAANQRALTQGLTLEKVLDLIHSIREFTTKPIVLLTYANIIGLEPERLPFVKRLAAAGVDGIIIADVPIEEAPPFKADLNAAGIEMIFLAAPTTRPDRLQQIVTHAAGFLYLVSVKGVTGARETLLEETARTIDRVTRAMPPDHPIPVCVGFGISKPQHVAEVLQNGAAGVIVGSAIIQQIADLQTDVPHLLASLSTYVQSMNIITKSPLPPKPSP